MSAPYGPKQPVLYQPVASQGMVVNPKNSLNKPDIEGKGREWSFDLCACTSVGSCCLAWCLPCIIYGSNRERLSYLERNGTPDPDHGGTCNSHCFVYGLITGCLGIGCILQARRIPMFKIFISSFTVKIGNRGHIRSRYGIKGGGCTDCLTSCFCSPCALTQEEAEIELEEKALTQQQGGYYQKA
ncbi:hypothetical protein C0989_004768 [Termitomyces sp. Mn162]|nr:hypothetical protein C0989_004768 [Termitomyces sp. Mn162]